MPFEFSSGVTGCVVNDQVVLFDVKANEYLAVSEEANNALIEWIAGAKLTLGQNQALLELIDSGVMGPDLLPPRGVPSPIARESLLDKDLEPYDRSQLFSAIMAQCAASIVLRVGAIEGAVGRLRTARVKYQGRRRRKILGVESCTNATLMAQAIVPSHERCLRRSLGLALLLAHEQIEAKLVFGVKLNTFAAHAWVQAGDIILNDGVDNVSRYTPILAV